MLNLQSIFDQARAVQSGSLPIDEFEEWLSDYAIGWRGNGYVGDALAKVDMILAQNSLGEIEESQIGIALTSAILPFVRPEEVESFSFDEESTCVDFPAEVQIRGFEPSDDSNKVERIWHMAPTKILLYVQPVAVAS